MTGAQRSRGTGARWSDDQVDRFLANLLRAGVIAAVVVGTVGGVLYLGSYGFQPADYRHFRGEPAYLRGVSSIVAGALALKSEAVVQLALLLLIATPVARVAFALAAFVLQRDRVYVVITLIVLALLLFSLFGGLPG
jgi:uncharacterized membrane protein